MERSLEPTGAVTELGSTTPAGHGSRSVRRDDVGIAPGTVIGRYVVEGVIGSGGMGVVFRARDSRLDRVVALKRLYPEQVRAHGEGRLLREARAMAQLSHPNVVPVYGVERWQGGAVLAMELVEGRSLEGWLREPQALGCEAGKEGLRWMLAAGEGLRAAHAAGLVHRDFKPSNVLLGADGRARVVDFGLARLVREPVGLESVSGDALASVPDDPHAQLDTRTGAGRVVGTVAYMAPEQLLGIPADARSDQYAFCVSLWEVLRGQRPFPASALASLDAKLEGPPAWPTELRVPSRIVAAVRRGLSVRPEQRWPSMDALLEELHAGARPRRRGLGWLAGAGGLALALAAIVILPAEAPGTPACTGAAEHLVGVWDDERRAAVRAALAEAGDVHQRDTWPRIERRLDAWSDTWIDAHTEACEATSVRGEATETTLDERMACLRDARTELRAVVGTLVVPSAADRAVELAAGLPAAERCLDSRPAGGGTSTVPPAELVARVDALHEALLEVEMLSHSGRPEAALARLEPLVEPIEALGWAPLRGELLMLRAATKQDLGDYPASERDYLEAHALGKAEGLPGLAVRSARQLVRVVGHLQARHAEALGWGDTALAIVRAEPAAAELEADVLEARAVVLHDQGRYADAAELQRRVLGLRGDEAEPLTRATSIEALGNMVERLGRPQEAAELYRQALALRERELGPEHLTVATTLNNLAVTFLASGESGQAQPLLERVLWIRERALGPNHVQLVSVLNNLGSVLITERDFPGAERHLRRMLALLEASFPQGHPHMGSALLNLGKLYFTQGRLPEAREHFERSLAMWERTLGPEHPKLAQALDNLGQLALLEGQPRSALPPLRRALALREAALGEQHPDVVVSLVLLGTASVEVDDARSARVHAERARKLVEAMPDQPSLHGRVELLFGHMLLHEGRAAQAIAPLERARASGLTGVDAGAIELALARALWDGGGDRRRAVSLARSAHASFHAHEDEPEAQRAERWLAEHRVDAR